MSRDTLNTQFWKACKILRQDDNTNSLLDYVEQISWLLFLKCLEEFEQQRRAEAEYEGKTHTPILSQNFQWSAWTNPDPSKKLTGQALLKFLNDELFPYLRGLQGNSARSVIRGLFEDAPSKLLKDGGILRDAIDAIQEIKFESAEDVHTLSHLYESMLAKLGREGGMGGEFYTPRPIIEFIVQMVDPKIGQTVYDPAMGSAGFLVEAYKHMRAAKGNRILPKDERHLQEDTFYGQEKKSLPYLLGCMNMILHGIFSSNLRRHNTLGDDVRKFTEKDRFDVILTNPPFGGTEHDSVTANFPYPSKATSITFLQHIMKKVKRGGKVGMVIDENVLAKTSETAYVQTKKELLEQFNLHTIISLPAGVFANAVATGVGPKTNLLFFDRQLDAAGDPIGTKEIWYYEVQAVGFSLTKTQRPIQENDLPDCLEKAKRRALSARSWCVSADEIAARNYDLSASNPSAPAAPVAASPVAVGRQLANLQRVANEVVGEIQGILKRALLEVDTDGWAECEIGAADLRINAESANPSRWEQDTFVYVDIGTVKRGPGLLTCGRTVRCKDAPSRARRVIHLDDVIFSTVRPNLRAIAKIATELDGQICSTGFSVFSCGPSIVPDFLQWEMCSEFFIRQCMSAVSGGHYPAINDRNLRRIVIRTPDTHVQEAVARHLEATHQRVRVLIESLVKALQLQGEEAQTLLPSILNEVFHVTDATRGDQ